MGSSRTTNPAGTVGAAAVGLFLLHFFRVCYIPFVFYYYFIFCIFVCVIICCFFGNGGGESFNLIPDLLNAVCVLIIAAFYIERCDHPRRGECPP